MRLGSLIDAASATVPERISGKANVAVSDAIRMSQESASSSPPPQQMPLIAAMTQERVLGPMPFLVTHGESLAGHLIDAADPFSLEHIVLEL